MWLAPTKDIPFPGCRDYVWDHSFSNTIKPWAWTGPWMRCPIHSYWELAHSETPRRRQE
jgi:hypothetical protein